MQKEKNIFGWWWQAFRNIHFVGRSHRKEFWSFVLVNIIVGFGISIISVAVPALTILSPIYNLVVFPATLCLSVRRLHDTGRSGAWVFAYYIWLAIYATVSLILFANFLKDFLSIYPDMEKNVKDLFVNGVVNQDDLSDFIEKMGNFVADADTKAGIFTTFTSIGGVITVIYSISMLVFYVSNSNPGDNKYGVNPKIEYNNNYYSGYNGGNNDNNNNGGGYGGSF